MPHENTRGRRVTAGRLGFLGLVLGGVLLAIGVLRARYQRAPRIVPDGFPRVPVPPSDQDLLAHPTPALAAIGHLRSTTPRLSPVTPAPVAPPIATDEHQSRGRVAAIPASSVLVARLSLWGMAIALALFAQRILYPGRDVTLGLALYAVAALLLIAATVRWPGVPVTPEPQLAGVTPSLLFNIGDRRRQAGIVLLAASALVVVIAIAAVAATKSSTLGLPLWLAGLVSAALGIMLITGLKTGFRLDRRTALELLLVVGLIALAFAFRFPDVVGIPQEIHGDEGATGIDARGIISGEVKDLFGLGWGRFPQLSYVPSAISLLLFGDNLFGLRMASVVQGTLSVGLLYAIGKALFSLRVGVMAAVVLAVSQMAVHYSRVGYNNVSALFASLLALYFLTKALSTGRPIHFLLSGFGLGLCLSVYFGARLTPVVVLLYCLHRAIFERGFLHRHWRGLGIMVLATMLFLGPQLLLFIADPLGAFGRLGVSVLTPNNLNHSYGAYHVSSVGEVLWVQFLRSIGAFNFFGENSPHYGQQAPLLDFASGALFVLGGLLALVKWRHSAYFLISAFFWLTLVLGSVLTLNAMFSPHMVGALWVMALFPVLALDEGWQLLAARFGAWGSRAAAALAAVLLVVIAMANYVDYFQIHHEKMQPATFFTVASKYIEAVNDQYRVYLLTDRNTSLRYDTPRFLIPNVDGVDVRDFALSLPLDRVPAQKGVVFVVRSPTDTRMEAIKAAYPKGLLDVHKNNAGSPQFSSYRVERDDLLAASPGAYVDNAPIPAVDLDKLTR